MPFKANQDCRQHIPKQRHRVTNWAAYDIALRQSGSLTVWFTEAAIAAWQAEPRATPDGQPRYSSGDDPAGACEISRFGLGCPLRLAGVFDLQLTPHPGSVIGIVALSGGTPEFRVLQQLEPADDLCATLFCPHRLAWRLAIEEGKRVIEGTPVVII